MKRPHQKFSTLLILFSDFYCSCLPGCFPVWHRDSAGAGGHREGVAELHEETHPQAGGAVGLRCSAAGWQAPQPLERAEEGEYEALSHTNVSSAHTGGWKRGIREQVRVVVSSFQSVVRLQQTADDEPVKCVSALTDFQSCFFFSVTLETYSSAPNLM